MAIMQSYKAACSMTLITATNLEIPIYSPYITSIGTDYNYYTNIMPIIYATLDVDTKLYDDLIRNCTDGKIFVRIVNFNYNNGAIGIQKEIVNDQFIYFIPAKYNFAKKIDNEPNVDNTQGGGNTKHIVLGLMKVDLISINKKAFNGNYVNTTTEEILKNILSGIPGINYEADKGKNVDEIQNNKEYQSFTMIPQETRAKALEYLFNDSPFYNTRYNFFMDFKKTYLVNSEGLARKILPLHTILFEISDLTSKALYVSGVSKDVQNGTNIIYINQPDSNYDVNTSTEKSSNQIVGFDTDEVSTADLNITTSKAMTTNKMTFIKANQLGVDIHKQMIDNTSITLTVTKMNMDTSIITPEKCYMVTDTNYPEYNGRYLIVFKKDILSRAGDAYDSTTIIRLQRIANQ